MSRLDELIAELCPNGIPYLCLGDFGQVRMCKRILKSQTNNTGGIPFFKIVTMPPAAAQMMMKAIIFLLSVLIIRKL